jgi:hypothetical protein
MVAVHQKLKQTPDARWQKKLRNSRSAWMQASSMITRAVKAAL